MPPDREEIVPSQTVTLTFEHWEDLVDLMRRERAAALAAGDTADAARWADVLDAFGERPDSDGID